MKNVLDIFLQQNGLTRDKLSKHGELSKKELLKASKQDPRHYSEKMLLAISSATNYSTKEVLDELLSIKDSDRLFIATGINEIRQKVNEQEDEFIIQGEFNKTLKEIKKSTLSETEELGFNLGSGGFGSTVIWGLTRFFNNLSSNMEEENLKSDIATLYKINSINSQEAILRLKQLD